MGGAAKKSAWDLKEVFSRLPGWAWPFVASCLAIPLLALGGMFPVGLGLAGAMGCATVAKDTERKTAWRALLCLGITLTAWSGFFAVQYAGSWARRRAAVPDLTPPKMERVRMVIDAAALQAKEASDILEPAWLTADIYGSQADYEASCSRLTRGQRQLVAVSWYRDEVDNGGHDQFYFNSTGIVWEDALAGLREIGVAEAAAILEESARRMGGRPSFDRGERQQRLQDQKPDFGDLDDRFYKLAVDLDAIMLTYIRAHPKEFLFDGEVERAVAPRAP